MKEYGLHFRHRVGNDLRDIGKVCTANSAREAKAIGKQLERPEAKFWFLGLIAPEVATATGGELQ